MKEKMCICGDSEKQHINGCEQCIIPECGCKEFEEVCEFCGGTGEITTMERVYPNEPHLAPIGSRSCICQEKQSFE